MGAKVYRYDENEKTVKASENSGQYFCSRLLNEL